MEDTNAIVCNLYAMTKNRAAIVALVKAMEERNNNQPPLPGVFPDHAAPVVVQEGGARIVRDMRWGLPTSKKALLIAATKRADRLRAKGMAAELRLAPADGAGRWNDQRSQHLFQALGAVARAATPLTGALHFV